MSNRQNLRSLTGRTVKRRKSHRRSERVTVNLTTAEEAELRARAAKAGVSMSQCLRFHLVAALDRSTAVAALREYDRQSKAGG